MEQPEEVQTSPDVRKVSLWKKDQNGPMPLVHCYLGAG